LAVIGTEETNGCTLCFLVARRRDVVISRDEVAISRSYRVLTKDNGNGSTRESIESESDPSQATRQLTKWLCCRSLPGKPQDQNAHLQSWYQKSSLSGNQIEISIPTSPDRF
jgi:hypothetical protein